jgi:hypothetical protein
MCSRGVDTLRIVRPAGESPCTPRSDVHCDHTS